MDISLLGSVRGIPMMTRQNLLHNQAIRLLHHKANQAMAVVDLLVRVLERVQVLVLMQVRALMLVQALVLVYAAISILGLLFGDILMGIVDPRISFAKKEGAR